MANQQYDVEADFVVVGAGSAGCVMATRLSEDPSTRVVLLEAGGEDRNRWIHIPLGYGKTFADASVNWCYQAEPDPGANGRSIFWPRGKVLGGSSSINGMVYIRGQHEDFDLWRQLGNAGWSSTDVLPYFKRAAAPDPRRGRVPQHRRPALRVRHIGAPSDLRGLHQGRHGTRLSAQRRLQRRAAGRRRLPSDHHAQRQALLHRGRLSAPGAQPAQPSGHHRRAGREGAVRRPARRRRRVPRKWPAAHRARRARSDPVRRRGELTAASVAVRRRPAGSARTVRHPGGAPSAGRRPEPAGSLLGADQAEVPPADHRQRRDAEQREEAEGRAAVLSVPHRPAHHGGRPCGAVRAHARRSLPRRM